MGAAGAGPCFQGGRNTHEFGCWPREPVCGCRQSSGHCGLFALPAAMPQRPAAATVPGRALYSRVKRKQPVANCVVDHAREHGLLVQLTTSFARPRGAAGTGERTTCRGGASLAIAGPGRASRRALRRCRFPRASPRILAVSQPFARGQSRGDGGDRASARAQAHELREKLGWLT